MSHLTMLVDRKREMTLLLKLLKGEIPQQILNICESGGKGKSFLLRAFRQECRKVEAPCSLIEFASDRPISSVTCLRDIVDYLGEEHFPEFIKQDSELHRPQPVVQIGGGESAGEVSLGGNLQDAEVSHVAGRDNISVESISIVNRGSLHARQSYIERVLTKIFRKELRMLCSSRSAVLIFDSFEHIAASTGSWLWKNLLLPIRDGEHPNLLIVLSGRPEGARLTFSPLHEWSEVLLEITAFEEFEKEHILAYFVEKLQVPIAEAELEAYHRICKNNPLVMGQIGDILFSETWLP